MKRVILTVIAFLLIPTLASAVNVQDAVKKVIAFNNHSTAAGGGASCQAANKDSYTAGASDGIWWGATGYLYLASAFTTTAAYSACSIEMQLYRDGTCGGNLTAHIYSDSAGAPGTSLYTSTDTVSANLAASPTYYTWTFNNINLSNATVYWIVIQNSATCSGNDLATRYGTSGSQDINVGSPGSWTAAAGGSQVNFKVHAYE